MSNPFPLRRSAGRSIRSRRVLRALLPAVLVRLLPLALLVPLLSDGYRAAPLPPVTARVTRLVPPTGTRAHGVPIPAATRPESGPSTAQLLRLPALVPAPQGTSRHEQLFSAALGRTLSYWIYLPPGYDTAERRYPVLYMLHGLHGSDRQWIDLGLFDEADRMIRARQIAPLIIVTPQGDNGYWMNHAADGPRWADYVIADVVPQIDATYRTLPQAQQRAIGGLSMGGHGAIQLALNHPGSFGVVGGHSPVFRAEDEAFPFFGVGVDYRRRDPVSLVEDGVAVSFALWLDMGAGDSWLPRTNHFHQLLAARGVAHSWDVALGGHQDSYWAPRLPAYLAWYDRMLRGGGGASQ